MTTHNINVRKNDTGVVRRYVENGPWYGDFIWAEGNYACDCNRSLFFAWAGGEPEPYPRPCGDGAYSVQVTDENGNVLYEDDDWEND
jgi:hypothetical protein